MIAKKSRLGPNTLKFLIFTERADIQEVVEIRTKRLLGDLRA